jgi:hypothetical protein
VLFQISLIWRTTSRSWIPGEHRSVPGLPEVPTDRIPDLLPSVDLVSALGISPTSTVTLDLKDVLALARRGLERRNRRNAQGRDETQYLEPLDEIVDRFRTPAEELLEKYKGPWGGSVEPVFHEYAY